MLIPMKSTKVLPATDVQSGAPSQTQHLNHYWLDAGVHSLYCCSGVRDVACPCFNSHLGQLALWRPLLHECGSIERSAISPPVSTPCVLSCRQCSGAVQRGAEDIWHFIVVGAPQCDKCVRTFLSMISCDETEGPASRLTIIGIQMHTVAMMLRLQEEELQRLGYLL